MKSVFLLFIFVFMALPFFYKEDIDALATDVLLDEDTSKHVVQVLRIQNGEQLQLTNGKGDLFTCIITDNNRKRCVVKVVEKFNTHAAQGKMKFKISIAISLVKNSSRFEWFLEKATEIGVTEIIPLICTRTEKTVFKYDRMKSILVSAMLQSQQTWLPVLHQPVQFADLMMRQFDNTSKLIAHCDEAATKVSLNHQIVKSTNQLICIGPEGDFTREEIGLALQNHFTAVALGKTRLRTETAGMVAATLLCIS